MNFQVVKPKLARPGRVPVTACAWGLEGKCIAGGLGNGSVQVCIILSIESSCSSKVFCYISFIDTSIHSGLERKRILGKQARYIY